MVSTKVLGTIWEVDDELWGFVSPVLEEAYPPKGTGRPRVDFRQVFNAIVYRMRTGCQWNRMPAELGSDSSNHRWFQQWQEDGVLEKVWAVLVERCDERGGVQWDWQAADAMLGKARFGGAMSARTRRTERKTARRRACSSMAKGARSPR
jgi:putative transposase